MHVCGKCKACKPKTKEFFYFARGIVNGACKECRKAANKKNAKEKRELKAKQSRAGFTCCECGEKRDSWLLHSSHGKTRCKICKAYKDHRRTKAPLPFVRFEIEWLHLQYNKKLMAAGFKRCTQCSQVKPFTVEHFGSSSSWCKCCNSANKRERATPEKRQKERQKAAEKAGRVYVPGGLEARAAFDKAQRMNAHVVAYRKAEAKKAKRAALIAAKPWNAQGLSVAEKFAIRYSHDPDFRRRNVEKVAAYKRARILERFDGDVDAMNKYLKRWNQPPMTAEERREKERLYEKVRDKRVKQATPPWADRKAIMAIYGRMRAMRRKGMDVHVDHIIPLRGRNVSGLHVAANLRVIDATTNMKKGARYEVAA